MSQQPSRYPFPPYGRQVCDRLSGDLGAYNGTSLDGHCAQIVVAVGTEAMGWPPRHPQNLAVAVAAGDDPLLYRWDWAAPHAPAAIVKAGNAAPEDYERTAAALIRDGAGLTVVALENGWTRFQRREAA